MATPKAITYRYVTYALKLRGGDTLYEVQQVGGGKPATSLGTFETKTKAKASITDAKKLEVVSVTQLDV